MVVDVLQAAVLDPKKAIASVRGADALRVAKNGLAQVHRLANCDRIAVVEACAKKHICL